MARRRRWPPAARRRSQSKDTASPRARVGPGKKNKVMSEISCIHCIGSHSGGNIHTRIEIPKTSSDQLPATVGGSIGHVSQIAIYRSEALISIGLQF